MITPLFAIARPLLIAMVLPLLCACAAIGPGLPADPPAVRDVQVPEAAPLRDQDGNVLSAAAAAEEDRRAAEDKLGLTRLPSLERWSNMVPIGGDNRPSGLPEGPFEISFEELPLGQFINEVFGRLLDLSFQLGPQIQAADDLVTLRLKGPRSGVALYDAALNVLASYGVQARRDEGLIYFAASPDASAGQVPLLVSGRALPSVPESHRPIFQFVPLQVLRGPQVMSALNQMFTGTELSINNDMERNAVILRGPPALMGQALSAIEVLDQPWARGREVLRIDPVWRNVGEFAEELTTLLVAQGYQVADRPSQGSAVVVVPIEAINALFVFAAGEAVFAQVEQWAGELDRMQQSHDETGMFRYTVKNTAAENIAGVVAELLGSGSGTTQSPEGERDQRAIGTESRPITLTGGRGLVVDELRNSLFFRGSPREWQQLRPLLVQMDQPTPMVMIEVTIAEITLTDQFDLGVEGLLEELDIGGFTGRVSTVGGLGLGGGGLTATLDNPNDARLVLNAFRTNERVNIVSRPHLMVKSGSTASIDVGTDVPIITSQASTSDFNTPTGADILQEVSFRNTGVLLRVEPIVRGRDVVDLIIDQEVSEAQQTETSNINSPSIFTRQISTELTARDGRALLMGGLISESRTEGSSGVPGLSRLPLIGRLFRSDGRNSSRTELVVMLIPYVLPDHRDAEAITEAFRARLSPGHPGISGGNPEPK